MLTRRDSPEFGRWRGRASQRGQTLAEFSLVAPLFFMVLVGIISLGMAAFHQQQVSNAAREGARYAALHSATARCPTVSTLSPDIALLPLPNSYSACDAPAARWPKMTAAARSHLFVLAPSAVQVTACWSGYWTRDTNGAWAAHDEVAVDPVSGTANEFRECTVPVYGWMPWQDAETEASSVHVINPRSTQNAAGETVRIDCGRPFPLTTASNDMASNYAKSDGRNANQVTVITCYAWSPPLAGFLLIPDTLHLVGSLTETMEYQQ